MVLMAAVRESMANAWRFVAQFAKLICVTLFSIIVVGCVSALWELEQTHQTNAKKYQAVLHMQAQDEDARGVPVQAGVSSKRPRPSPGDD